MAVMVKALGYYSHKIAGGLSKVKAHLKYLEHGKIHDFKPRGFDRTGDSVGRAEFMEAVEKQPQRGVIAHKLVFSLSQDERDRLGVDLKTLVRESMKTWEQELGRPLNWVGFQHEDKGHPHVHVVVAGYAGSKQVGLYERDLNKLRGWTEREKERQSELSRGRQAERSAREEAQRLVELVRPGRERIHGREIER